MNKQGTKFVGAAYQYFFIKQMLIFRVIFILNNFFSNYIVAKFIILHPTYSLLLQSKICFYALINTILYNCL